MVNANKYSGAILRVVNNLVKAIITAPTQNNF